MTEQFIQLIEDLVKISSPSQEEAEAAAYLVNWMKEQGFTAHIDEAGNAIGSKGNGPKEVMLLGHIDTFPGTPPVYRAGDILYGRGSVDAKGPLCTFAAAVSKIDVPDGWQLTVVGAVEEEAATSKGARHMLTTRQSNPPAYCIIGEPSHWDRVTLGYKGRLLMHISMDVPFTHSAGEADLPAEVGVNLWQTIQDYAEAINQSREKAFDRLDPSLRSINTIDQGVYGEVNITVGFRLPVDIKPDTLDAELRALVTQHTGDWPVSVTMMGHELAHRGSKSNPLVRAFLTAIRSAEGKPRFVVKTGTSDMNVVAPVWQCPILAYGPGDSSLDHTPDEHLDLNEYFKATDVLEAALRRLITDD